jgi:serine/threonine protein kinase
MMMRYQLVETKQEGFHSTVVLARDVIHNTRVVLKIVDSKEKACGEIEVLSMMGHPSIMHLLDCYEMVETGAYALVLPVVDMDLDEFMCVDLFDANRMMDIKHQMAEAMCHMHNRRVLHGDIKPENMGIILPRMKRNLACKLLDMGSAKKFDDIRRGTVIPCTQPFVPPEASSGGLTPAWDVWQTGLTYKMMECKALRTSSFSELSLQMTDDNAAKRPTFKGVLIALNHYSEPLATEHPLWRHPLVNTCDDKSTLIRDGSSSGIQRVVTLLQHGIQADDIECAFWMLLEASCKEVEDYEAGVSGQASVLSCLHYFHARINFGGLNKLFYCKSLCRLSTLPYFVLSDDMKLHMNDLSGLVVCERSVLKIISRSITEALLMWCVSGKNSGWGKNRGSFVEFVGRFKQDWDSGSVVAASSILSHLRAMGMGA